MLTKREPKYKIGTLLRNSYGPETSEQVMIVRTYVIMGQTTTHEGLVVGNEVRMYDLMYLGEGGRKDSQTERWLHRAIANKKIEIEAIPD